MKEYFKKLKKEHTFYSPPANILSSKTFTSDQKLVLIAMVSDLELNGCVKWCQNTYADKTGTRRAFISKLFKRMEKFGVLKQHADNKVGSRYNTYEFNTRMFELLLKANDPEKFGNKKRKPVSQKPKPVSQEPSTCIPETQTCIPEASNLYPRDTHIDSTYHTESIDMYKEQGDDSLSSSPVQREKSDEELVADIEIDF